MKKLKQTLVVWIAIYPAITAILSVFGTYLNELPILLRTFILTIILVPFMVYILIPFWTKILNESIIQKKLQSKKHFLIILMMFAITTAIAQSSKSTEFKPLHLVISVPDVEEASKWYISTLDFKSYQKFKVPSKGLSAHLLKKGDFELMLMKSDGSLPLPESRKSTFTDLNVEGVKRIAFEVDDIDQFISRLKTKNVAIDVNPRLFQDTENNVSFRWAIIKDNNGNLLEFVQRNHKPASINQFLVDWGNAWSPEENAPNFDKESIRPFYLQSEKFLAFDSTDDNNKSVIKGAEAHHNFWEPFMRQFKFWTFSPDLNSLNIHTLSENTASVSLYVDNFGILPDGTKIQVKAHATLILVKKEGNWKIAHENIWGPVNN